MKRWVWIVGLALSALGCGKSQVGTETGNPPTLSPLQLSVTDAGDGRVRVEGEAGAVSPAEGEVSVRNVTRDGAPVSGAVDVDGSFSVELEGLPDEQYEVIASNARGDSPGRTVSSDNTAQQDWQQLHACDGNGPVDAALIHTQEVVADQLTLSVSSDGGCAQHRWGLCYLDAWAESEPVQVTLVLLHDAGDDSCDSIVTAELSFDLTPLKEAYAERYPPAGRGSAWLLLEDCVGNTGRILDCEVLYEWNDVPWNEGPTMIRAHNVSDFDYENVVVDGKEFGNLASGERSEYLEFEGTVYRYAPVELDVDGTHYDLQPIDYVGETPLGGGHFAYEIGLAELGGGLTIGAVEENN